MEFQGLIVAICAWSEGTRDSKDDDSAHGVGCAECGEWNWESGSGAGEVWRSRDECECGGGGGGGGGGEA